MFTQFNDKLKLTYLFIFLRNIAYFIYLVYVSSSYSKILSQASSSLLI